MNFFLYTTTVCIWGSTWLAILYQLGSVPLDFSIFYRFSMASLLVFVWCFFRKKNMKFSWPVHLSFMAQGFFQFSMNFMASYAAGYYIISGLNAIGFSMILVFNIINAFIFFRTPITLPIVVGALCGIIGIATIFWIPIATLDFSSGHFFGIFLSLFGGLLSSFGNMISLRNHKKNIPVTESNAYAMGYGSLFMLGIILFKGLPFQFEASSTYIFSLLYLAIFGSILGFGCYLTLLGRIGASKAGYALVMLPVVALGISTFFENFIWDSYALVGLGLILSGNVIMLTRKSAPKDKGVAETLPSVPLLKKAA